MKSNAAFTARTVLALTLVAAFAFSAFVALSTFAPDLRTGRDGRAHGLSRSAVGFAGLLALERARGRIATVTRRQNAEASFVVFTPEAPTSPEEIEARAHYTALVVLPKWIAMGDPSHPGWVRIVGQWDQSFLDAFVEPFDAEAHVSAAKTRAQEKLLFTTATSSAGAVMTTGPIAGLQTISGPGLDPIVTTQDGRAVLARVAEGTGATIYIIADPDFLNTRGLADQDTARAGLAMIDSLRSPSAPLVVDVTLNGFESARSFLRTALTPPFLGASLSFVAVALLLGWRAAVRAAPASAEKRAIALGKRALADNAAALIRNAGREAAMGWPYVQQCGQDIAERLAPARRRNEELSVFLDRMGVALGAAGRFSEIAASAGAAQTRAEALEAAKQVHAWMKEMRRASI